MKETFQGIERYRNPFQKLYSYEAGEEPYEQAREVVYTELDEQYEASRLDKCRIMRMLNKGEEEEAYDSVEALLE